MSDYFLTAVLTFIVACLMVALLFPGAYSLPKNLLDQMWDWRKRNGGNGQNEVRKEEKAVISYFYAFDLFTFLTVLYSIIAALIGICLLAFELEEEWLNRIGQTSVLIFLMVVYLFFSVRTLIKGWRNRKEPEWLHRRRYLSILGLLIALFFIPGIVFAVSQCRPQLLFLMGILLISHIGFWLYPHYHYMPLTNLQILRELIQYKDKKPEEVKRYTKRNLADQEGNVRDDAEEGR